MWGQEIQASDQSEACDCSGCGCRGNNKIENEIVANSLQFISQDWKGIKNIRVKRLKKLNIAILSWTITSKEIEESLKGLADNITFEHYEPDLTE